MEAGITKPLVYEDFYNQIHWKVIKDDGRKRISEREMDYYVFCNECKYEFEIKDALVMLTDRIIEAKKPIKYKRIFKTLVGSMVDRWRYKKSIFACPKCKARKIFWTKDSVKKIIAGKI